MKQVFRIFSILLLSQQAYSQHVYQIRADSVRIYNVCDTAELIIENRTRGVAGFLFNKSNGRTEFRRLQLETIGGNRIAITGQDTLDISTLPGIGGVDTIYRDADSIRYIKRGAAYALYAPLPSYLNIPEGESYGFSQFLPNRLTAFSAYNSPDMPMVSNQSLAGQESGKSFYTGHTVHNGSYGYQMAVNWDGELTGPKGAFIRNKDDTQSTWGAWRELMFKDHADNTFAPKEHRHDAFYYTKQELQTGGQASVHAENITSAPWVLPGALTAKEDVANKSTSISLGTSNTLYPTQNAVKSYVDAATAGLTRTWQQTLFASNIATTTPVVNRDPGLNAGLYADAHFEARSNTYPALGFHRPGNAGMALYLGTLDQADLRIRTSSNTDYKVWHDGYAPVPVQTLQQVTTAGNATDRFLRVTGQNSPFGNGPGLELFNDGDEAFVQSYDRTASAYKPLSLIGSLIKLPARMIVHGATDDGVSVINGFGTVTSSGSASGFYFHSRTGGFPGWTWYANNGRAILNNGNDLFTILDNGNIGIGTTTPSGILEVGGLGDEKIRLVGGGAYISFFDGAETVRRGYFQATVAGLNYDAENNGQHIWYTNNSEKMRLLANGNVGIGTNFPSHKFVVSDGTRGLEMAIGSRNYLQSYNRGTSQYSPIALAGSDFQIMTGLNGSVSAVIDESGSVGIGLTAPPQRLSVSGNIFASTGNDGGFILEGNNQILRHNGTGMQVITGGGHMFLNPNGANVGIGTPNPSAKLDVNGIAAVSSVQIRGGNPAAGMVWTATDVNGNGTWTTPQGIPAFSVSADANKLAQRDASGQLYATGFYQSSHSSLKQNIKIFSEAALPLVNSLVIKEFSYKNDKENSVHFGIIADSSDWHFATKKYDRFDTNSSLAIAIKAIQELSKEKEQLRKQVSSLEERLRRLEELMGEKLEK